MYFRLPEPGRPLSPTSKLARVFDLVLGPRKVRLDRLPMRHLKHKLFRVVVGTVEHDHEGRPLPTENQYSVIRAVLERLA